MSGERASLKYFMQRVSDPVWQSHLMSEPTYQQRAGLGRPMISIILGLVFIFIGLDQILTGVGSFTIGILTIIVGLLSCGLALYRIFYVRGIRNA